MRWFIFEIERLVSSKRSIPLHYGSWYILSWALVNEILLIKEKDYHLHLLLLFNLLYLILFQMAPMKKSLPQLILLKCNRNLKSFIVKFVILLILLSKSRNAVGEVVFIVRTQALLVCADNDNFELTEYHTKMYDLVFKRNFLRTFYDFLKNDV